MCPAARRLRKSPTRTKAPALSAGIVPVYWSVSPERKSEPLFLLLRVYNYWDFPKGRVLQGEDPLEGALRELREETTLDQVEFCWGKEFVETEPYSYGKIARYYLGRISQREVSLPIQPALQRPEHHEFRWCTYEEATSLLGERVRKILDWSFRRLNDTSSLAAC